MRTSTLLQRCGPLLAGLMVLALSSLAASAPTAQAQVSGSRMELGELVPTAPDLMHGIDIGPSPAPGASRLVSRGTIERQVRRAGFDPSELALEPSVRARRSGQRYTAKDLEALITGPVEAALPRGMTLIAVKVSTTMTLEQVTLSPIELPKFPKRTGVVKVAFSVEFRDGSTRTKRLPITAVLSLTEEATAATVSRGQRVQLVIQHGVVRISAESIALGDGDIGDEMRFRVLRTGKILLAKVDSPTSAIVREQR